ncbi:MAG: zinc-ribbon domain-containing protein [Candidatus Hodarchaeales archaeon]
MWKTISCGKPLLPNAQYCGYCGSKHEFLEIPREKSEEKI